MVNLTIPAIAAACLVFVLVSWNILLPFTSAKNADFLNYAKYTMENWLVDNPQLQQISDAPIVKSVKASMIDQFVTDEKNNFNIGPRILAERYPGPSNVTLTFYVEYNDQQMMPKLIETLHSHNVKKAVFFIEDQYALDHPFMIRALKDNGYKVSNWANMSDYDHSYSPTLFRGIVLSDKDLLSHSLRDSNAAAFLETAVHYSSTSTIAFTPKIMYHELILDQILQDSDNNTLILTDTNEAVSSPSVYSTAAPNYTGSGGNNNSADLSNDTSILGTSAYSSSSASSANASSVVIVENTEPFYISTGNWTIEKLHHLYPSVVTTIPEKGKNAYLLLNSLTMSNPTELDVTGVQLYLRSSTDKDPNPVVLLIRGKAIFNNSLITSWNSENKRPDIDSFHPRPFVIAKNGGIINVYNSEISYLGYSLGGVEDTRYARAAISYYNTSNFEIEDSKIAFNYCGFYSDHANNYRIVGNEIFGNTRYGLDPHTGSSNFLVDSNYIHDKAIKE